MPRFFCFERIFILRRFLESQGLARYICCEQQPSNYVDGMLNVRDLCVLLSRVFHMDSDCVLLQPLTTFPLEKHRIWLCNNDFYHLHGFSPLPSASVHACVLDSQFCEQFELLFIRMYRVNGAQPPAPAAKLLEWATQHARRGGAGGISDMTLYFLLQVRSLTAVRLAPLSPCRMLAEGVSNHNWLQARDDDWGKHTLGWVNDVGDLCG